jgi:hypothetical protein
MASRKSTAFPSATVMTKTEKPLFHRFPFTSQFSDSIRHLVNGDRIQALMVLMPEDARVAENEKDGIIVNHYVNTENSKFRPEWAAHKRQANRDIFYG